MRVLVCDEEGARMWERNAEGGFGSRGYNDNGMQDAIIRSLKTALIDALAQRGLFDVANRVLDIRTAAP